MRRAVLLSLLLTVAPLAVVVSTSGSAATAATAKSAAVFPTVSGGYGATPKITFPKGTAPTGLESKTLVKGTGPLTVKGDLLVANYVGQIWNGKVFDSSFERKQLSGFPIGVGGVIAGWDDTLVGVHTGSRMLLVIPPKDGYGSAGNSSAGITGKDVLVFVVDVVAVYNHSALASSDATSVSSGPKGISVVGKVGAPPKVTIAKGTKTPTAVSSTVLARGHGATLHAGLVVCQFEFVSWTGTVAESTWATGSPYALNVDLSAGAPFPNNLAGLPIGSRVLFQLEKNDGQGPFAVVLDVVAQPKDPQT